MNWQDTQVSLERTHHVLEGRPCYVHRFDEVMSFHPPGLAAVSRGGRAWHISPEGQAVYDGTFLRTFGFYADLATVIADDGWGHIDPSGRLVHQQRFEWSGNFQDGLCTVRNDKGVYWHINSRGEPAYSQQWRYTGDFRNGVAVVQGAQGRSTHIAKDGSLLHGEWFTDLDVYHKGFARARDCGGWMHIDRYGEPAYVRRFASVEPFYNGQARVERFDGGLEVIDEAGQALHELRPAIQSEFHSLSADLVGFWKTETIATAVKMGLFESLPGPVETISSTCQMPVPGARRLLKALQELNLTRPTKDGEWRYTDRGAMLSIGHPLTLADAAQEYAGPLHLRWQNLQEALQADRWQPADVFEEVGQDPDRCRGHHRMLGSYARHDYGSLVPLLGLKEGHTVVDAGGGTGVLAQMILENCPVERVTVLDRPEVVADVPLVAQEGRLSTEGTDIFDHWGLKADVVILARVLHDWADELAIRILANARQALSPDGHLVVLEMVRDEHHPGGSLCDLHLLCVTGGKERTRNEFEELFAKAGFKLNEVNRGAGLVSVITGVPA